MPTGELIKAYPTLAAATKACFMDGKCNVVSDADCDQYMYWTYTGGLTDFSSSCSWIKSSISYIQKLIHIFKC